MRRVAVFVDAGYFWVQATQIIIGRKSQRNQISVDYELMRKELLLQTQSQFQNVDLLRVYWYDGPGQYGKTPDHCALEELDDFKLRLGARNGAGDQKAVDGLIIADMISLAQSKAISDALLISGDADLSPGVIAAQNLGIRVHLLSMGPTAATSPYLRSEVDFKHHWSDAVVQSFAKKAAVAPVIASAAQAVPAAPLPAKNVAQAPVAAGQADHFRNAAVKVHGEIDAAIIAALNPKDPIPREIDGRLLSEAKKAFDRTLTELEKRQIRVEFRKLL